MDVRRDRDAFISAVRAYAPLDATAFGGILDALITWSREHDWAVQHAPRRSQIQAVVKFALPGMTAPFWTAYPRQADGAKLCVVDSGGVFPEPARAEARRVLAALDGRAPEPNEAPTVSFARLRSPGALREVKRLLCRLLVELNRHDPSPPSARDHATGSTSTAT